MAVTPLGFSMVLMTPSRVRVRLFLRLVPSFALCEAHQLGSWERCIEALLLNGWHRAFMNIVYHKWFLGVLMPRMAWLCLLVGEWRRVIRGYLLLQLSRFCRSLYSDSRRD